MLTLQTGSPSWCFFGTWIWCTRVSVKILGRSKELRWLTVSEALQHLKHPGEKRVLTEKEAIEGHDQFSIPTWNTRLKLWWKRLWLSASAERLMESLNCYSIELKHLIHLAEEKHLTEEKPMPDKSWAVAALALLSEAREALKEGDENRGWNCFLGATRMELWGLKPVNPAWLQLRGKTIAAELLTPKEFESLERGEACQRGQVAAELLALREVE
jgi:hypothetical protein